MDAKIIASFAKVSGLIVCNINVSGGAIDDQEWSGKLSPERFKKIFQAFTNKLEAAKEK